MFLMKSREIWKMETIKFNELIMERTGKRNWDLKKIKGNLVLEAQATVGSGD